jgi:hypothetical protein
VAVVPRDSGGNRSMGIYLFPFFSLRLFPASIPEYCSSPFRDGIDCRVDMAGFLAFSDRRPGASIRQYTFRSLTGRAFFRKGQPSLFPLFNRSVARKSARGAPQNTNTPLSVWARSVAPEGPGALAFRKKTSCAEKGRKAPFSAHGAPQAAAPGKEGNAFINRVRGNRLAGRADQ